MSYKMPKLTDKKKLCPRCGSPMMDKSDTLKYCPVCHFSESSVKTEIKIKIDLDEKQEALPKIEILKVSKTGTVREYSLESENSYVVVDRASDTLWIWKGAASSPGDAYKAGVETTKLKPSLRMYSAKIKRVEEGDEPDDFPKIGAELKVSADARMRKEDEERRLKEEQERKLREEEERKRKLAEEEERKRKLAEEEERKRKEAEEQKLKMQAEERRKEEEQRRLKEEERKRRLEEEQKQKELEQQKRLEEEERKRAELEEREAAEAMAETVKEEPTGVWEKVATDTKSIPEVTREVSEQRAAPVAEPQVVDEAELNEAISSLTLVRGISKEIATALYKANITTIMELSLGNPEEIARKSGLDISVINEIISNAKDLLGFD